MTPEQTEILSNFLNSQANLPVSVQEIADALKEPAPKKTSAVKKIIKRITNKK